MQCFSEVESLVKAIQHSLAKNFNSAVQQEVKDLAEVFDVENAVSMLAAYGFDPTEKKIIVPKDDRILWETYRRDTFQTIFDQICKLPHIKSFSEANPDKDMLPHLHDVIFKRYKDTIRDIVWLDHGGISMVTLSMTLIIIH